MSIATWPHLDGNNYNVCQIFRLLLKFLPNLQKQIFKETRPWRKSLIFQNLNLDFQLSLSFNDIQ